MATTPYPFVASTVLTASQLNSTFNIPVTTVTASHTLVAGNAGTRLVMNSASATTITVNTSVFSAGDNLQITNIGAGVTTVTAGTATVSSAGPLAIPQYGGGTLYFTSAGVAIFFPSAGPAPTSALTLVGSATLSSTSTKITSVFSATYDNYLISVSDLKLSASAGYIGFNLLSGSTSITTGYNGYLIYYKNSVNTGVEDPVSTKWSESFYQNSGNNSQAAQFQILQPFLATSTWFNASNVIQGNFGRTYNGENSNATSYDGIELTQTNGFASGKVRIYGYALT
jgi:hypothetical protein